MARERMNFFHLAFGVNCLEETRRFYVGVIGCTVGRSAATWIDFNLFGHQISAHLRPTTSQSPDTFNAVDGDAVPIPHFGCILDFESWSALRKRLEANEQVFEIGPRIRFEGQAGEQATMFFRDPSGNALEFKSFRSQSDIFADA